MNINFSRDFLILAVRIVEQFLVLSQRPCQGLLVGEELAVKVWQVALLSTILVVAHRAKVSLIRVIHVC